MSFARMWRRWAQSPAVLLVAMVLTGSAPASAQLTAETIVRGLTAPIAVAAHPELPDAFVVAEQRGLIRLVRDGALLTLPFLDLRSVVVSGGERGLLGVVFAPDFPQSRRLFVNFTNRDGETVIARFRVGDSGLTADPDSRFDLRWPDGRRVIRQPFENHNGGHLAFGRDGYMYIGLGDGGSGGDPMHLAQNPQSLLGKMLRIDVGVPDSDDRGYRVPEDNPFVDGDPRAALGEIWAFGLRNPWRYSVDDWTRGGTGAFVIADVGQSAREEVNFEPAGRGGRNYGWRLREGRLAFDGRQPAAYQPLTEPIHDYGRAIGGSITGGLVYRGAALDPSYTGRYFYADFISGRVFSIGLHLDAAGEATAGDEREHTAGLGGASALGMVSSFAADASGELLLLNYSGGAVLRVVPDLTVVPRAPVLRLERDEMVAILEWDDDGAGVAPRSYLVERVREGAVVERREEDGRRTTLEWADGDCFRVRGVATTGVAGPSSPAVCAR